MYSVIVCIGMYLNLFFPTALVIPHITVKHPQDLPIKAFREAVGLRVEGAWECVRSPLQQADLGEELRRKLDSIVGECGLRRSIFE